MYICGAVTRTVSVVIDVLPTVGVADLDRFVTAPMSVLNPDLCGVRVAEDCSEDYNGSEGVHLELDVAVTV